MTHNATVGSGFARPDDRKNSTVITAFSESLLETAIATTTAELQNAETHEARREANARLCDLVGQRSVHRVRFMERLKGLR